MSLAEYQQQCLDKLVWATQQLGVKADPHHLKQVAVLIVETMTGPWRFFHTPHHIFQVGGYEDPIEVLAALFHDVVYVQVDQCVHFNLAYHITPFARLVDNHLVVREAPDLPQDPLFEMVMALFDVVPGQTLLPFAGLNEFLSAVVAAKVLEPLMSPSLIVQIIACIEATIPFQPVSKSGVTATEQLGERLRKLNPTFDLALDETLIAATIKRGVRVANRDVGSFGGSSAYFLDNTWSLLPETNHCLHSPHAYSIREYRQALQKMADFMDWLQPGLVFRQFQDEPNDRTYGMLIERARYNLSVGRLYLRSKLLTIAILEAISLHMGQNIPLTMLVGTAPTPGRQIARLEDFLALQDCHYQPQNEIETEVLRLLETGRNQTTAFDIKNSPFATLLVKSIGFSEVRRLREPTQKFFTRELSGDEFLACCDSHVVQAITQALLHLLESRQRVLAQF
jgi:hypothetical protein